MHSKIQIKSNSTCLPYPDFKIINIWPHVLRLKNHKEGWKENISAGLKMPPQSQLRKSCLSPKVITFLFMWPFSCSCFYTFSTDLFMSIYVLIFYIKGIILKMAFCNLHFWRFRLICVEIYRCWIILAKYAMSLYDVETTMICPTTGGY